MWAFGLDIDADLPSFSANTWAKFYYVQTASVYITIVPDDKSRNNFDRKPHGLLNVNKTTNNLTIYEN